MKFFKLPKILIALFSVGIFISLFLYGDVWAVNKCLVKGKVIYQDIECELEKETPAQETTRQEKLEKLHRKLDLMDVKNIGVVKNQPIQKAEEQRPQEDEPEMYVSQPRGGREQRRRDLNSSEYAKAMEKNRETEKAMNAIANEVERKCGKQLLILPLVGMSDEAFRMCTTHGRFGGVERVIVGEDGGVALRLYLSSRIGFSRVYSVGGVITAIKP